MKATEEKVKWKQARRGFGGSPFPRSWQFCASICQHFLLHPCTFSPSNPSTDMHKHTCGHAGIACMPTHEHVYTHRHPHPSHVPVGGTRFRHHLTHSSLFLEMLPLSFSHIFLAFKKQKQRTPLTSSGQMVHMTFSLQYSEVLALIFTRSRPSQTCFHVSKTFPSHGSQEWGEWAEAAGPCKGRLLHNALPMICLSVP